MCDGCERQIRVGHRVGEAHPRRVWPWPAGARSEAPAKTVAASLGGGWPRAIRSGTGRGGDVTGSRVSVISLVFAGAGSGDRRLRVAERDPYIEIALRLPLHEAVAGVGPGQHGLVLVV